VGLRAVPSPHQGQEPALGLDPGDERGVGYVKHNAIAGHAFISWAALEGHLDWWMREIADRRVHGTTGEVPLERFQRDEALALKGLDGRPPAELVEGSTGARTGAPGAGGLHNRGRR
jgi:hypothetical protein